MKKLYSLKHHIFTFILLNLGLMALSSLEAEEKKNILLIVCDDMNTYLLDNPGRYNSKVIAPNMTKLANSGVNFRQAYTASPKCQPSRAAILTGVAPWSSGLYDNSRELSEVKYVFDVASMGEHFKNHGFFVSSYGKISHGYQPHKNNKRPFEYDEYFAKKTDKPPKGAPISDYGQAKYKKDTAKGKNKLPSEDWGPYENSFESEMDDTKKANMAIDYFQKDHNKPFLLMLGFFHPHQPFYAPQKYIDLYKNSPLPPMMENPQTDLDDIPVQGRDLISDKIFNSVYGNDEHKELVRAYLGCVTYTDGQVGRVLDALNNSKYKDNTIVVLISDHGFHLGEKSHITKGTIWECATNSLMMWRVPGLTKSEQVSEKPVSLLDVYPTLCELSGIGKPEHKLDGNSLVPLLKDTNTKWDKPVLMAQGGEEFTAHFALRHEKYRYVKYWGDNGGEELYDREKDPQEWNNLVGDEKYVDVLNNLRKIMPTEKDVAKPARKRAK